VGDAEWNLTGVNHRRCRIFDTAPTENSPDCIARLWRIRRRWQIGCKGSAQVTECWLSHLFRAYELLQWDLLKPGSCLKGTSEGLFVWADGAQHICLRGCDAQQDESVKHVS
jgi:hypothetical protein